MTVRLLISYCLVTVLLGCSTDQFLDSSIPRVTTPFEQIAFVRTTWFNGELRQTTFIDKQNRILEDFTYGRTNWKTLNQYQGDKKIFSAYYYHNDSSTPGFITISKSRFEYDSQSRVKRAFLLEAEMGITGIEKTREQSEVRYTYGAKGDTLFNYIPLRKGEEWIVTNSNRWERNKEGQLIRNFRLYILKGPNETRPDTMQYYSHRFAYDNLGRRKLAWFNLMYLWRFYTPAGPDTIHYFYDNQSRLVREKHVYTIDKRNKMEIDTTSLDKSWRKTVTSYRQNFFVGSDYFPPNEKTDIIEYRYEWFDPAKHLPLQTH